MGSPPFAGRRLPAEWPGGMPGWPERRTNTARVLVILRDLLVGEVFASALTQSGFLARVALPDPPGDPHDLIAWNPSLVVLNVDLIDKRPTSLEQLFEELCRTGVPLVLLGSRSDLDRVRDDPFCGLMRVTVDKNSSWIALVGTLCRLLRHDSDANATVRRHVPERRDGGARSMSDRSDLLAVLTHREREVLAELMDGRSAETIAAMCDVSISTVRSQIKSILQKLGVNSQLAAVALAQGSRVDRAEDR
jgi:two-component system, NarL family, nitrate/nitrite response regulator NarL